MIYDTVTVDRPIHQGDIFRHVPRVDLSLTTLPVVDATGGTHEDNWRAVEPNSAIAAVLPVKSVTAIVMTQNCDAERGEYICLAQVDPFLAVIRQASPPKTATAWQKLILKYARTNHRLFYLPAAESLGFSEPMVADFRAIVRVPRLDLEDLRERRLGCLNKVASEHFRESLSHSFRRYAYEEWYPLTKEQFEAYAKSCGEAVEAFPWQQ